MYTKIKEKDLGFTIIELISVLALLGILLLFATPNFLKSNEMSTELNIKNNIMIVESKSKEMLRINEDEVSTWSELMFEDLSTLNMYSKSGKLVNWEPIESEKPYLKIPENIINSTLMNTAEGIFFINNEGDVYNIRETK